MGATFPRIKQWIAGETLTAAQLNSEFNNILSNLTPTGIDDASSNSTAMQALMDVSGGSLPTSLKEELQGLRYQVNAVAELFTALTQWYSAPSVSSTGSAVKDEDDMVSDSPTQLATQQSIKAYIDTEITNRTPKIRDIYRDLIVKTGTDTDHDIDIDADEIILNNSSGASYKASSVNLTVAIDAAGANGLDTGAAANTTWYYIWVIYDSTGDTLASLLSTSGTFAGLTLPGDYDYGALVGCMYTNGSANWDNTDFYQRGRRMRTTMSGTASISTGNFQAMDISTLVPPNATYVYITCSGQADSTFYVHPANIGAVEDYLTSFDMVLLNIHTTPDRGAIQCPIETPQQISGVVSAGTVTIKVQGWEL